MKVKATFATTPPINVITPPRNPFRKIPCSGPIFIAYSRKGTRAEHRAIRILESCGYVCTRAGGSLGLFDVIAIGPHDVRIVQVKCGGAYLSAVEREQIMGPGAQGVSRRANGRAFFVDFTNAIIITACLNIWG